MSETLGAERLRAELIVDRAGLDGLSEQWRQLAVELGRPAGLPEWVCAGRAGAPEVRVIALFTDESLVAIAPFELVRRPSGALARPMGWQMAEGFGVMARTGYEDRLAQAARDALRQAEPRLAATRLWSVPGDWLDLYAAAEPAGRTHLRATKAAPFVALSAPDAEAWLAARSKNFRRTAVRADRALSEAGGRVELLADAERLPAALEEFFALHHARWSQRGGSGALTAEVEAGLWQSAPALLAAGHLRLWRVVVEERAVGVLLCLVAGPTYTTWLGGYDTTGAEVQAGFLLRMSALRDAYALGATVLDLGTGDADFKRRFASGRAVVMSGLVCEPTWRGHLAGVAAQAKGRLPERHKRWLRELSRRNRH